MTRAGGTIRVLLVDDHELMRLGMAMALAGQKDVVCCGAACGGREAIELARTTSPDVVVMDLTMPDVDGFQATREIVAEHARVRVLVLTWRSDPGSIAAAFAAGASGYLLKGTADVGVLEGIRAVHAGRRPAADVRNGDGGGPSAQNDELGAPSVPSS